MRKGGERERDKNYFLKAVKSEQNLPKEHRKVSVHRIIDTAEVVMKNKLS